MFKYRCMGLIILLALLLGESADGLLETNATSNGLIDCDKFLHVNESSHCPPWTIFNENKSRCECGDRIDFVVKCSMAKCTPFMAKPMHFWLAECYCMSYDDKLGMEVVGACPYLCTDPSSVVPQNRSKLNDRCNFLVRQNRTGELCGRCLDGYAPSAYSIGLQCANCSNYQRNWIKYIAIAYLPLILLYVVVLLCRINALSAKMAVSIFICQIISSPPIAIPSNIYFNSNVSYSNTFLSDFVHHHSEFVRGCIKFTNLFYGVWNLDFYRYSFDESQGLCLHPNMSTMQVLSLDYLIAFFPILLIAITFLMVKIYDQFKLVQYFSRRLIVRLTAFKLLGRPKCKINLNVSLIETFGTFMLLSYVKVINCSLSILMPVHVKNVTGHIVGTNVYYNGSQEYFGDDHLPYAVLAIFMFTTFNLMPLLLLCLYPCRCFQSCLNCCRLNSQVLRTFMDAFQGCYKFEPYDCRYFSGLYLFLRIIILLLFYCTLTSRFFYITTGMIMLPVIFLLSVIRPYRKTVMNSVDIGLLLMFALSCFSISLTLLSLGSHIYLIVLIVLISISFATPPLYILAIVFHSFLLKPCRSLVRNCHKRFTARSGIQRSEYMTDAAEGNPLLSGVDGTEDDDSAYLPTVSFLEEQS